MVLFFLSKPGGGYTTVLNAASPTLGLWLPSQLSITAPLLNQYSLLRFEFCLSGC